MSTTGARSLADWLRARSDDDLFVQDRPIHYGA